MIFTQYPVFFSKKFIGSFKIKKVIYRLKFQVYRLIFEFLRSFLQVYRLILRGPEH